MQECSVTVRLAGSLLHTVPKDVVTPAEIQILRAIHGVDAVVDITPTKMNKRNQVEEFDRLTALYGTANQLEPDGATGGNLVARLFPGANARLPVTLKEIGLGHLVGKDGGPATPEQASAAKAAELIENDA